MKQFEGRSTQEKNEASMETAAEVTKGDEAVVVSTEAIRGLVRPQVVCVQKRWDLEITVEKN